VLALMVAGAAAALTQLARRAGAPAPVAAVIGLLSAGANLTYQYSQHGAIKEIAMVLLVVTAAAVVAEALHVGLRPGFGAVLALSIAPGVLVLSSGGAPYALLLVALTVAALVVAPERPPLRMVALAAGVGLVVTLVATGPMIDDVLTYAQGAGTTFEQAGAGAAGAAPVLADESTYRTDTTRADHGTAGTAAARASATGALGVTGEAATGERRGTDGDAPLQVVEEQLRVGKREVGRGSVRVRSYVTERPIEEQVELRQERVTIERRPVDRELRAGDPAFEERSIEVVERGEEAVVSKTARVVEEVAVGKEVERETETVRDTVRRQDVEVDDDRTGRDLGVTGTTTEADTTVTGTTSGTDRTPLDPTTR
jgi:uncharacterized protein (TIGR02271 family)